MEYVMVGSVYLDPAEFKGILHVNTHLLWEERRKPYGDLRRQYVARASEELCWEEPVFDYQDEDDG